MTQKEKQKIVDTLDSTRISNTTLNQLIQDRNDFAFDSIYFRYAIMRDELAVLRARILGKDYQREQETAKVDKMHFYNALEQWTQVHQEGEENGYYFN